MSKKKIDLSKIQALPGRTVDYSSEKKAKKRARGNVAFCVLLMIPIILFLIPIIIMRLYGTLSANVGGLLFLPVCLLLGVFCYAGSKQMSYTGRCGLEQLDAAGSPYLGKLTNPKGHIRPVNLLGCLGYFVVSYAVSVLYLVRVPSEDISSYGFFKGLSLGLAGTAFIFCLIMTSGFVGSIMLFGWGTFWAKLKQAFRQYLPAFLVFQASLTLFSALVFFLMSKLSASAGTDAVVESVASRILDSAYDTGSASGFLFGKSSVLTALSTASVYTGLFDTLIEHIDDKPKSFGEQIKEMASDRGMRRSVLLMLISFLYVGISRFAALPSWIGIVLRVVIFLVWLYCAYRTFADFKPVRYMMTASAIVFVDQLLVAPAITNFWTGLLAVVMLAVRIAAFLATGVMLAFYYKMAAETSLLHPDPDQRDDPRKEQTLDELWREDEGKGIAESLFEMTAEVIHESVKNRRN